MILDERNEFCDATALNTGAAASYLIGDVIDTGMADSGMGDSDDLYLCVNVDTAVTSGGSGTYAFKLCSDAQAAIAVDGTQTIHFATALIAKTVLVAGYQIAAVKLPRGTYERYVGIVQETAVAAATAGKVNAFLTKTVPVIKAYDSPAQA